MSAKKAPSNPPSLTRTLRWLVGPGRPWFLGVLILAGFVAAALAVWRRVRDDVLASGQFQVSLESFELTPPPAWIHRDLRAEVFRDLTLDGPLSAMDDNLVERVRNAFALHPWIARVEGVRKLHPAKLRVDVVYRRPACMVEAGGELLPVDAEGVRLPDDDFTPLEKQTRYLRLMGIESGPLGPVGARWGNPRVAGGAEIAGVLLPAWERLGLERIVPSAMPNPLYERDQTYELLTRQGTWIFWGRASSEAAGSEPSAADKLARLEQYFAEHGILEGPAGPQKLDLTRPGSIEVPAGGR